MEYLGPSLHRKMYINALKCCVYIRKFSVACWQQPKENDLGTEAIQKLTIAQRYPATMVVKEERLLSLMH